MQPVIMLLMSGFFMFAVIGGISLLAHYYTLNGIKSKTVGDGQHGTARFATREEIKDTYEQITDTMHTLTVQDMLTMLKT